MSKDWSRYNEELVKRGEIPIDPAAFGLKAEETKVLHEVSLTL